MSPWLNDNLAICGNQWDNNGYSVPPVRAGRNVGVAGNTSGNRATAQRTVVTVSGDSTLDVAPGSDWVYLLAAGATAVVLPTAVDNTARCTVKNISGRCHSEHIDRQLIDGATERTLTYNAAAELISDGANWWTL